MRKPGTTTRTSSTAYTDVFIPPNLPAALSAPEPKQRDLSDLFKEAAATARARIENFTPTLAILSAEIDKLQAQGYTGIGFTLATTGQLLKDFGVHGLSSTGFYGVLEVNDSRFLLEFLGSTLVRYYREDLTAAKENLHEKMGYNAYNLSDNTSLLNFLREPLTYASLHAALEKLRQFEAPAEKSPQKQPIKHKVEPK